MLEFKITGAEQLNAAIAKLPARLSQNAAFEALVVSLQPLVDAVRREAPSQRGFLKLSIGVRLRKYRGGKTLYGVVGPRLMDFPLGAESKGAKGDKASPYRYAHLVERGHWAGKGENKVWVPANAFMRRAWTENQRKCFNIFRKYFGDKLLIEVANRRRQTQYI